MLQIDKETAKITFWGYVMLTGILMITGEILIAFKFIL